MTMSSVYSNSLHGYQIYPTQHLWDVVERDLCILDVQPTNAQQLCNAVGTTWTKINIFSTLLMPLRTEAVMKVTESPTL